MNAARKNSTEGLKVIADGLLAKAAAANDARIAPMVEKLMAVVEAKPDSYFDAKLYPTASTLDAGAFQKVWREVAAEVAKG